ncbi:hypothetical protein [Streptococcus ovuberis]|nr:hypothetical protein [Streptococcus ovuberis]
MLNRLSLLFPIMAIVTNLISWAWFATVRAMRLAYQEKTFSTGLA